MLAYFQTEAPVGLTPDGRPKRRSRKQVDYAEAEDGTLSGLEKYLEKLQKEPEQRSEANFQTFFIMQSLIHWPKEAVVPVI